jgi:hypothetical protein
MVTIWIPGLRTPSVANLREHCAKHALRVKDQRIVAGCKAGVVSFGQGEVTE